MVDSDECIGSGGSPATRAEPGVPHTRQLESDGKTSALCSVYLTRLTLDRDGLIPRHPRPSS